MANFPMLPSHFIILPLLFILSVTSGTGESHDEFVRTMDKELHGIKKEKLSHFRVYWHDIVSGAKPSGVQIVPPPANYSRTGFGFVRMIDNPLTLGPELSSKLVGKAQGFYGQASQEDIALLMAMNFAFTEGKYNGSTITVLGRNPVLSPVREMSVIGGSGLFRLARGYALLRTHTFNQSNRDATVEYNIYVLHY